jgi:hypothetical protein
LGVVVVTITQDKQVTAAGVHVGSERVKIDERTNPPCWIGPGDEALRQQVAQQPVRSSYEAGSPRNDGPQLRSPAEVGEKSGLVVGVCVLNGVSTGLPASAGSLRASARANCTVSHAATGSSWTDGTGGNFTPCAPKKPGIQPVR